jgi:hypothetical protein
VQGKIVREKQAPPPSVAAGLEADDDAAEDDQ